MESATTPDTSTAVTGNGAAAESHEPDTFPVHRPIDGSVIREVQIDSPASVAEAVARVRTAQPAWEAIGCQTTIAKPAFFNCWTCWSVAVAGATAVHCTFP